MANRRGPHLYTKRGVFYLQKRVPTDLEHRYGRPFIGESLRTKDPKQANRLATSLVDGLEREWLDLRFGISEETPASDLLLLQREQEILLSTACADYCRMKGQTGDKSLSAYTIHDAKVFRDALISRGVSTLTVKRNFGVIRPIWNLSAREHGVASQNSFSNMNFGAGTASLRRESIPLKNVRIIQDDCVRLDDDIRWLVSLTTAIGQSYISPKDVCIGIAR